MHWQLLPLMRTQVCTQSRGMRPQPVLFGGPDCRCDLVVERNAAFAQVDPNFATIDGVCFPVYRGAGDETVYDAGECGCGGEGVGL